MRSGCEQRRSCARRVSAAIAARSAPASRRVAFHPGARLRVLAWHVICSKTMEQAQQPRGAQLAMTGSQVMAQLVGGSRGTSTSRLFLRVRRESRRVLEGLGHVRHGLDRPDAARSRFLGACASDETWVRAALVLHVRW